MRLRRALKQDTDDLHEALDARLGRFDLGRPKDYRDFLVVHGRVLPPLERALDRGGIADFLPDWPLHRRTPLLERDLETLGVPLPPPIEIPPISGTAALLGTAYVVEGSRLGSRYLARRVGGAMPAEYLNAAGQRNAWPALLAALDSAHLSPGEAGRATEAARRCFSYFLGVVGEAPANG